MIDADPNLEGRVLDDVSLQLFDVHGNLLIESDDWETQDDPDAIPASLRPTVANEAAIRTVPNPGAYTPIVRGKGANTGLGIVEIFSD